MAVETTKIPEPQNPSALTPQRPSRPSRWSGYRYLLWVRLLELKREPEIIFWVFGFPLLLSLGLGIAFRNKPADQNSVAVVAGPNAPQIAANLGSSGSDKQSSLRATVVEREAALKAFRLGKFDVVVEQKDDGTYWYYYDPARPESMFARLTAIDTLEAKAGRADKLQSVNAPSSAPGSDISRPTRRFPARSTTTRP